MYYIGFYVRIDPPVAGASVPPAGYVALVCIFLFAAFFQVSINLFLPLCSNFPVSFERVVGTEVADMRLVRVGPRLLDLRLRNTYRSSPHIQCRVGCCYTMDIQFSRKFPDLCYSDGTSELTHCTGREGNS